MGRDSSFVLEDSGSDSLAYIPSQIFMPQKLTTKYEKDQDSEEIASLTAGKEMKSYSSNLKITGSSSFNTNRESNK